MTTEEGVTFNTGYQLHPSPLPVCLGLLNNDKDGQWARHAKMPFSKFRKATLKTQFYFPREGNKQKNIADEWIRLSTGEKFTNAALGYVCDMWPMPAESFLNEENPYDFNSKGSPLKSAKFWYPTVLLNLDIKKQLPKGGVEWLFVRVATKQIKNGRMDLEIIILDEGAEVVAISHHVALAISSERNLADRQTGPRI